MTGTRLHVDDTTQHFHVVIDIVRDHDGRWASRWPAWLVTQGGSPGAGRHDARRDLIAAIEAKGWQLTHEAGDVWTASKELT